MSLSRVDFKWTEMPSIPGAEPLPVFRRVEERPVYDLAGRATRAWLFFAVASLLVSGLFALLLVAGRVPPFSSWITDPDFFRRCLVLHVNLSLLVWFCAFTACLFSGVPGSRRPVAQRAGLWVAAAGAAAMALSAFAPGSDPVLSNYIPFIDHPLFGTGLVAFFLGLATHYLAGPLAGAGRGAQEHEAQTAHALPPETALGVRVAALLFIVALTTFAASWAATPASLAPEAYFELAVWGGGHVLQVANVAAMIAVWLWLVRSVTGRAVIAPRTAGILFGLLALPHLVSPLLTFSGTATALYHTGFTRLMQFGIFPVATVLLVLCSVRLAGARRAGFLPRRLFRDYRPVGFGLSAGMTLAGFALGAMIRGSNTMIPAHYHASIGAVTVAFMAAAFVIAERFAGSKDRRLIRRWAPVQLCCFGGGQLLFALGFAVGGAYGLGRKEYGSDQVIYSAGEYAGLGMMGLGGLIAVAGGAGFLVLMAGAFLRGAEGRRADGESRNVCIWKVNIH